MSYNEPTWPQQPHYYQQQPPFQAPPPQQPSLLQQFKRLPRKGKVGIGCLALLPLFMLCSLCTFVVNVSADQQNQGVATAAPSPTKTPQAIVKSTDTVPSPQLTPTSKPTPTPSPQPTPTPTARPKPSPTQPPIAVQPTPVPTKKPTPTPNPCPNAVNHNPWCYDFNGGNVITNPPAGFCSYFACISSFYDGKGYVVECGDGMYSKSGGRQGSCSKHGGEKRILYSH